MLQVVQRVRWRRPWDEDVPSYKMHFFDASKLHRGGCEQASNKLTPDTKRANQQALQAAVLSAAIRRELHAHNPTLRGWGIGAV